MPKQIYVFYCFYGFFMNFPWWKLTKFSQNITSNGIQIMILNTKQGWVCKGSLKNCLYRFPEKWTLIKVKYWLPVCQILWTFAKRNRRKFTVTFVFCGHVHLDIIKILILSFCPQHACSCKTKGSHLKYNQLPSSSSSSSSSDIISISSNELSKHHLTNSALGIPTIATKFFCFVAQM